MVIEVNLELVAKDAAKGVKRGDIIVVVDVLRCSSTIITSLANGAISIIPAETLKEALGFRKSLNNNLLAGERNGLKPEGFDLGNSPLEFTPENVAGKNIVLTTTSGARALVRSGKARWVLIGAFLNAETVAMKSLQIARKERVGVSLASSGRKGSFSLEDFMCAGAIIESLRNEEVTLSDAAFAAALSFRQAHDHLYENVRQGVHAQHLVRLGFEDDIEFCCRLNYYPSIVPVYRNGIITLLS